MTEERSMKETVERLKAEKEMYTGEVLAKAEALGFLWATSASYEDLLLMNPQNTENSYALPSDVAEQAIESDLQEFGLFYYMFAGVQNPEPGAIAFVNKWIDGVNKFWNDVFSDIAFPEGRN